MSLDELLKDPKDASTWSRQRKKLLRVVAGVVVSAVALIAGIFLVLSLKPHKAPLRQETSAQRGSIDDKDVESLAELMRVRKRANELKADIGRMRAPASVAPISPKRTRSDGRPQVYSYDPGEGFETLTKFKTEIYIPTGAVFQAQLLTPIKTSVEKTFVLAETTNEFRMDMRRRILPASRLIGTSHFDPVLKAVVVEFNTLVSPSGIESPLNGLALSRNALPEIEGLYFSDKLVNYGTALAFGFLSGFSSAARERETTIFGTQPEVSIGNQVLSGLSVASFQVANQILNDIRSRSIEYVVVPAGERIFVVLTRRYEIGQNGMKNGTQ